MPELPEVETIRREMAQALLAHTIQKVKVLERRLRFLIPDDFASALEGLTISGLSRRAKYIILTFQETPLTLVIHLGMSGCIALSPFEHAMPHKHEHIIFSFTSGKEMRFSDPRRFGFMILTAVPESLFHALGPEPLSETFNAPILNKALQAKKTSVKVALLDQHVIAGLGNIYVSEALHLAHIHPERAAKSIKSCECDVLASAIKNTLEKAILAGGSTLRDHKRPNGNAGLFQEQLKVYGQAGKSCLTCRKSTIERITQSRRSTYFCRNCQF